MWGKHAAGEVVYFQFEFGRHKVGVVITCLSPMAVSDKSHPYPCIVWNPGCAGLAVYRPVFRLHSSEHEHSSKEIRLLQ